MRETGRNGFQKKVKDRIKKEFPECSVHKMDSGEVQGIPDLIILCPLSWATLEVKGGKKKSKRPNQSYYVDKHDKMSCSSFIFPENEEKVFDKLHKHFNKFSKNKGEENDI